MFELELTTLDENIDIAKKVNFKQIHPMQEEFENHLGALERLIELKVKLPFPHRVNIDAAISSRATAMVANAASISEKAALDDLERIAAITRTISIQRFPVTDNFHGRKKAYLGLMAAMKNVVSTKIDFLALSKPVFLEDTDCLTALERLEKIRRNIHYEIVNSSSFDKVFTKKIQSLTENDHGEATSFSQDGGSGHKKLNSSIPDVTRSTMHGEESTHELDVLRLLSRSLSPKKPSIVVSNVTGPMVDGNNDASAEKKQCENKVADASILEEVRFRC